MNEKENKMTLNVKKTECLMKSAIIFGFPNISVVHFAAFSQPWVMEISVKYCNNDY